MVCNEHIKKDNSPLVKLNLAKKGSYYV